MRTTVDIRDDLMRKLKDLAQERNQTLSSCFREGVLLPPGHRPLRNRRTDWVNEGSREHRAEASGSRAR